MAIDAQWEYAVVVVPWVNDLQATLDGYAARGFRLVAVTDSTHYFERNKMSTFAVIERAAEKVEE